MNIWTIYKKSTGQIIRIRQGPAAALQSEGSYIDGRYDPDLYWVPNGKVTERPESPIVFENDILKNLPSGSRVFINNEDRGTFAGDVALDRDFPNAPIIISVFSFPYRDFHHAENQS